MNFKSTIFSLVAVFSFFTHAHAADTESLASFRDLVTNELLQDAHNDVVGELIQSGVSQADAEQVFVVFVDDIVDCLVTAAEELAARRGVELNEFLSDDSVVGIESIFTSNAEFEEFAEPCIYVAVANAGLSWE